MEMKLRLDNQTFKLQTIQHPAKYDKPAPTEMYEDDG